MADDIPDRELEGAEELEGFLVGGEGFGLTCLGVIGRGVVRAVGIFEGY